MKTIPSDTGVLIREYRAEDEPGVLELLRLSLGAGPSGERSARFFRWKHSQNVFGPSLMWVAEADGTIVGLRAFMRWEFRSGSRTLRAARAVDTATHPAYRGRGIFEELTRHALSLLDADVDLIFNTPNDKSLRGYLKMGWRLVGVVPVRIRVRHPVRLARRIRSIGAPSPPVGSHLAIEAESAASTLGDADDVMDLLDRADVVRDVRLSTPRTLAHLRWRYGPASGLGYRAVRLDRRGRLEGMGFFRVRPRGTLWEATVADIIVPAGETGAALQLLRRVASAANVDHVTVSFPKGSEGDKAAALWGAIATRKGMVLVAHPLRRDIDPDPIHRRSWALRLGDLEVF